MVSPVTAVAKSDNRKLGKCSATYVSQDSCPRSCPWFNAGCYAENGPIGYTTRRLNQARRKSPAELARLEAVAIDQLPGDRLLRLHVVGDCRTSKAAKIIGLAARRYASRGMQPTRGKKSWTYSHGWRAIDRKAWGKHVSVLASVESPAATQEAMANGYAAALVVPEFKQDGAYEVDGVTVIPCPNQTKGVTCDQCGLCRDDSRLRRAGLVIGFAAHGNRANSMRVSLPTV